MSERGREPTEDELRAAYEQELKRIRVEQVLLEHVVSLINIGMRRTGLAPGSEDERDLGQVALAIEAVRALAPLAEQVAPAQAPAIRDALSQLQLAFVRLGGASTSTAAGQPAQGSAAGQPAQGSAAGQPAQGSAAGQPAQGSAGEASVRPAPQADQQAPTPASRPQQHVKPGEPGPAERSGRLWVPGR